MNILAQANRPKYLFASFILVSPTSLSASTIAHVRFVQFDATVRATILTNGFRYGEAGQQRTEEIVQMALQLLAEVGKTDLYTGETLRGEFERQVSEYHAEILGEYFAKSEITQKFICHRMQF